MTSQINGFYKIWKYKGKANFACDKVTVAIDQIGNWRGRQFNVGKVEQQFTREEIVKLNDIMYVPKLRHNLFSLTKGITEGGKLTNKGNILVLSYDNHKIKFDYPIKTKKGCVMAVRTHKDGSW
jgi:hypothetical protein